MNVVALRHLPLEHRPEPAIDLNVARVAVFHDLAAAEAYWRALESAAPLATPYQRYDFLRHWQTHVGALAGVTPFIVVGLNAADTPLFLWPLGQRRSHGLRIAAFLGGKHANFNMGIWRRELAGRVTAEQMQEALAPLRGQVDLLQLTNQPLTWSGTTNPFALYPHQYSASFGYSGSLIADFEALFRARTNSIARKKMRKKERALAEIGAVRFEHAREPHEVRRILDVFFKQKNARMRSLGLHDAFTEPGVRRFIEAAVSERGPRDEPPIELYALLVDDIVVATMGGIVGGGRFCGMFNSIAQGRYAAESPGEQLIVHLVRECCARQLETFDLGIGESRYKTLFCEDAEPLFDNYVPLSGAGALLARGYRAAAFAKRFVKQHPLLWGVVSRMRRLRGRLAG